ncbi:AsmA-like C-terminal region-containing protein [Simiduia curdlanivorans]|uniref:YhdP family protein n=1 Tax=Simiduia curdlanivorans TaxID=1492769 RepID=A0ABV8V6R5_9GAMM|nr:AsmA-like C-terminal region-containing protein [Simiduia curdlanivorans]MDN3638911.1 AsmA-like C-terminal region-containing protein [Simiduia curdlanivorans]
MKKLGSFLAITIGHFWRLIALLLILCALLVQLGRMATPMVADYREPLIDYLTDKLGMAVAIQSLDARWESLLPVLALEGLVISTPNGKVVLEVESALAEVDLIDSVIDRQLRFSDVEFLGVRSNFVENATGAFSLEGLSTNTSAAKDSAVTPYTLDNLRDVFLIGKQVNLIDLKTRIRLDSGHELEVTVNRILLEHGNNRHRLSATIQLEDKPEAISLTMEGSGDPFDISEFGSKAYLRVDNFPTEKLLALVARRYWQSLPEGRWRREGQASIEAWLTLAPDKGLNWLGRVSLSGLPFELKGHQVPFRSIDAEIVGDADFDGNWLLQLQNINMQWGDTEHPPFTMQIQSSTNKLMSINADRLVLQHWHKWLSDSQLLAPALVDVFDELAPAGSLENVHLSWPQQNPSDFLLQTNLTKVSAQAWRGAPTVTGVDGYLETTKSSGFVDLDSRQGFSMHYTTVYENAMAYDSANGQVAWWLRPEEQTLYVNSGPIRLAGDDGNATGFLYINAPIQREDHTLELLLQIGIENSAAQYHKKYVPFVVSENLRQWLDVAVQEGDVRQGGFIFHGFIAGALARMPSVQLWLDIENAALDYSSPWPAVSEVSAELVLDTSHLLVNASSGRIYDSILQQAKVELITQESGSSNLLIDGRLAGPLADGQKLLAESPLADITNHTFANWQMAGDFAANLALNVPMTKNSDELDFDVQVEIGKGELALPFINLSAKDLTGGIRISRQNAIAINSLKGTLWNQPLSVRSALNDSKNFLEISLAARADIADLVTWAGFSSVKQVSGISNYAVAIDVPWGAQQNLNTPVNIGVSSDLIGLAVNLPTPLNKASDQKLPFALDIPLTQESVRVTARAGNVADSILLWSKVDQRFAFDRGAVQLFGKARLPEQPMLRLGAGFERFDLNAWLSAFDGQWSGIRKPIEASYSIDDGNETAVDERASEVENEAYLPLYIVLNAEQLVLAGEHEIGETHLEGIKSADRWAFSLQNERLAGTLDLPLAADSSLDLSLKVLRLPLWAAQEAPVQEGAPVVAVELSSVDKEALALEQAELVWQRVKSLPKIHAAIASLYVKEKNIGQLTFDSYIQQDTWHIDNITGALFGLSVAGWPTNEASGASEAIGTTGTIGTAMTSGASLSWNHGNNESVFTGQVKAGDLGAVMEAFDTKKLIESNRATFNANLAWRGDPYGVKLESLRGDIDFQVKDGRFMRADASASNALMRLMGIFNFDTWIRRLQLDFSDVYASGMAYDEVKGALEFDRGLVQFNTPVSVKTPSSKMQMEGQVNLVDNTIDTKLTVNLPVLDNLTFIAAVSAGLPVAAGVFVASRLFEKQFDKMTSVNYRVVGALDNPSMQFKQVADNPKKAGSAQTESPQEPAVGDPTTALDSSTSSEQSSSSQRSTNQENFGHSEEDKPILDN